MNVTMSNRVPESITICHPAKGKPMTRIFTPKFFRLSLRDQVAVVEHCLHDIEKNFGRFISPQDETRARRRAARIRKTARQYGIL
jgi:predicted metallopeptidase